MQSPLLILLMCCQYVSIAWYCASYIPFAQEVTKSACTRVFSMSQQWIIIYYYSTFFYSHDVTILNKSFHITIFYLILKLNYLCLAKEFNNNFTILLAKAILSEHSKVFFFVSWISIQYIHLYTLHIIF